jgi:hypothetical protein
VRFENVPTPDGKGFVPVAVRADGSYDMAGGYMPSRDEPLGWQKIPNTEMYVMTGAGSEKFSSQTWRKEGDLYVPNVAPATSRKVQHDWRCRTAQRVSMQRNPQTGQWEAPAHGSRAPCPPHPPLRQAAHRRCPPAPRPAAAFGTQDHPRLNLTHALHGHLYPYQSADRARIRRGF